jgi:dodecin
MSIARSTEITATSTSSFEDAIRSGIERAGKTLQNLKSAWIKDQEVVLDGQGISAYKVTMKVTFVLND